MAGPCKQLVCLLVAKIALGCHLLYVTFHVLSATCDDNLALNKINFWIGNLA
jgi:hypothetical protein